MDDETVDVELDTTTETETTEETPTETEEQPLETPDVDVEALQATNKKLYERAKKAEAELKAVKGSQVKDVPPTNVEETVLLATGLPEELLGELKAVAQVRKVSLIKAQNDPIFVAVKEKFEKDQKKKDASMPASRGAGSVKAQKTFTTPGLSRDEHREMFLNSK